MDTDLKDAVTEFTESLNTPIGVFGQLRDQMREHKEVGRNLSLAITHLEDAQDKLRRAMEAYPVTLDNL